MIPSACRDLMHLPLSRVHERSELCFHLRLSSVTFSRVSGCNTWTRVQTTPELAIPVVHR